ncbi:MAG: branched-chain amino acid ABC transporter permease [Candidimonas sp.]|nr:MAG: branched-chain amino acid ABC transporter permease [Candidimonas sp.]
MKQHAGMSNRAATGLLALTTAILTVYLWLLLRTENQLGIAALLVAACLAIIGARRLGWATRIERASEAHGGQTRAWAIAGALALIIALYDSDFQLLMLCTVLLYTTVCLGLNMQFGFTGIPNFAGAAFFGVGSYTAAVMTAHTGTPHLLILLSCGIIAALVGCLLILPVLRTRSHYTALVTIAFGILFKTFLEVNDSLGGPQGLQVPGMSLFGYHFNDGFTMFGADVSFYASYALLALVICALAYLVIDVLRRSWIGLSMDVVRTDETAAAAFGLHIARWKVLSFTLGNFMAGVAGGLYAMATAFVAPNNFTFSDSLLMVSIVILGGLGNSLGILPAALIVLVLPEKFQFMQEYRFLFYAALVIVILLFRPDGLIPRKTRLFFKKGAA